MVLGHQTGSSLIGCISSSLSCFLVLFLCSSVFLWFCLWYLLSFSRFVNRRSKDGDRPCSRDTLRETIWNLMEEAATQLEREITEHDISSIQLITIIYEEHNQSVMQFPNQNSEALQRLRQDANDPNCIDFTYSVVLSLPDMRKGLYHIYQKMFVMARFN